MTITTIQVIHNVISEPMCIILLGSIQVLTNWAVLPYTTIFGLELNGAVNATTIWDCVESAGSPEICLFAVQSNRMMPMVKPHKQAIGGSVFATLWWYKALRIMGVHTCTCVSTIDGYRDYVEHFRYLQKELNSLMKNVSPDTINQWIMSEGTLFTLTPALSWEWKLFKMKNL